MWRHRAYWIHFLSLLTKLNVNFSVSHRNVCLLFGNLGELPKSIRRTTKNILSLWCDSVLCQPICCHYTNKPEIYLCFCRIFFLSDFVCSLTSAFQQGKSLAIENVTSKEQEKTSRTKEIFHYTNIFVSILLFYILVIICIGTCRIHFFFNFCLFIGFWYRVPFH